MSKHQFYALFDHDIWLNGVKINALSESYSGLSFKNEVYSIDGKIIYKVYDDLDSEIRTEWTTNKDRSRHKQTKIDLSDGSVLDVSYEDFPYDGADPNEGNDILDINYYGSVLNSTTAMYEDGNLGSSYDTSHLGGSAIYMDTVKFAHVGKKIEVNSGFTDSVCKNKWDSVVNGTAYQVNAVPATMRAGKLNDFRMSGHHFVEAVRNVNRMQLSANTLNTSASASIETGGAIKLNNSMISFNFAFLEMKTVKSIATKSIVNHVKARKISQRNCINILGEREENDPLCSNENLKVSHVEAREASPRDCVNIIGERDGNDPLFLNENLKENPNKKTIDPHGFAVYPRTDKDKFYKKELGFDDRGVPYFKGKINHEQKKEISSKYNITTKEALMIYPEDDFVPDKFKPFNIFSDSPDNSSIVSDSPDNSSIVYDEARKKRLKGIIDKWKK